MQRLRLLPLAFALTATACFDQAPSIHPLFVDTAPVPVEGVWRDCDREPDKRMEMAFERRDDYYLLQYGDAGCKASDTCTRKLRVRFGRLSGRLFADFTEHETFLSDPTDQVGSWPVHAFARVELTKDRLEFSVLDRDWLRNALEQQLLRLKHEKQADEVVLTASTRELQRFVTEWAHHPDAFGEGKSFER